MSQNNSWEKAEKKDNRRKGHLAVDNNVWMGDQLRYDTVFMFLYIIFKETTFQLKDETI